MTTSLSFRGQRNETQVNPACQQAGFIIFRTYTLAASGRAKPVSQAAAS